MLKEAIRFSVRIKSDLAGQRAGFQRRRNGRKQKKLGENSAIGTTAGIKILIPRWESFARDQI
jgi:hypothetical protein